MKYTIYILMTGWLLTSLLSCQQSAVSAEKQNQTIEEKTRLVKIDTIQTTRVEQTIEYSGNLLANKEIYFAPATPGRIEKILVEIGDRVKAGQILIEMDKTQLSQAITQLSSAKDSYDRIARLNETGSIAEQQYEQAKTQLELAELNVELLRKNLNFTAPINGIITAKYFENGELYSGAPNTQVGKAAVVVIQQINPIKVDVNISQSFLPMVKEGMQATFTTDIYPGKKYTGRISRIHPYVDPMSRTFKIEFLINNPVEILKPGMSVDMMLPLKETEGILLPSISVLNQSGTNNRYLFIYENGIARKIDVKIVKRHNDLLEVQTEEPLVGKQLIIEGQDKLLDGDKVEIALN
jgi:RND family efflux transporter MFP subunit